MRVIMELECLVAFAKAQLPLEADVRGLPMRLRSRKAGEKAADAAVSEGYGLVALMKSLISLK